MMLMTSNAVKAFMKGKNVILGGNISVAAGPLGRYDSIKYAVFCRNLRVPLIGQLQAFFQA